MKIHVVRPGDTVSSVAEEYGVSPARLAADNEVPDSGALAVGQTLVVCFPTMVHTVRPGDTLMSVAKLYGVSVRQLWQKNWPLQGGTALTPGQDLTISCQNTLLGRAEANGYAYPFTEQALLAAEAPYQTYLTPFTYGVTAEGQLLDLPDAAVRTAARDHGAKPVLHLSAYTEDERFDTDRAVRLLNDGAARLRLIADVERTLAEKGFAGVDVDFEFLPPEAAQLYAAFIQALRTALSPKGYFVWAALAPKTSSGQKGLLYEGHDYASIGAAADAVLLMTYEWGYTYLPCCYMYLYTIILIHKSNESLIISKKILHFNLFHVTIKNISFSLIIWIGCDKMDRKKKNKDSTVIPKSYPVAPLVYEASQEEYNDELNRGSKFDNKIGMTLAFVGAFSLYIVRFFNFSSVWGIDSGTSVLLRKAKVSCIILQFLIILAYILTVIFLLKAAKATKYYHFDCQYFINDKQYFRSKDITGLQTKVAARYIGATIENTKTNNKRAYDYNLGVLFLTILVPLCVAAELIRVNFLKLGV